MNIILFIKTFINRIIRFFSNTISGSMVRPSNPFSVAMAKPFHKIPSVLFAVLPTISSTTIMAATANTNVSYITQVIVLTNDDEISKEFRPYKQMIERLSRTYKASYHPTNVFDNYDGANYDFALWVAYYNFLRPHKHNKYQVLNKVDMLSGADNMPGKWQLLIFLGQQTILNLQAEGSNCS